MDLMKELSELDVNNAGEWSLPIKIVAVILLGMAVIGAVYYFDTQNQLLELQNFEAEEQNLRNTFTSKYKKAANLDAYKQQLAEMKESFGSMLKQLPNKTEVASLLVEVSQTGLATGLEFQLFRPGIESNKGFYAELPIIIKVSGNFHEFGSFVSGLAALPRIVTIHDVTIVPKGGQAKIDKKIIELTMDATAKTYRYLEEGAK